MKHPAKYRNPFLSFLFSCLPILSLSWICPTCCQAQKATLTRQVPPVEISKRSVSVVLEDSYGFVWYGGSGLYRYDGYKARKYHDRAVDSLQNKMNTINALLEDSQGQIWIGASTGLYRYDRGRDKIVQCFNGRLVNKFGHSSNVLVIYKDPLSRLWLGSEDKLFLIPDPAGKDILTVDVNTGTSYQVGAGVKAMEWDEGHGQMIVATTDGLYVVTDDLSMTRYTPGKSTKASLPFRILDLAKTSGDSVWLATGSGLWLFKTGQKIFRHVNIPGYEEALVRELLFDGQDLWIATNTELWKRLPDGSMNRMAGNSLALLDAVNYMVMDRFGNLWLGGNNGVGRLDFGRSKKLPFYRVNSALPQQDNCFFRIMQDSIGGFWFRMIRSGLGHCDALGSEFELLLKFDPVFTNEEIKNFCTDVDGNVWVMTLSYGLFLFPRGQKKGRSIDLGDSMKVAICSDIIVDRKDDRMLWFSSNFGLCGIDRFTFKRKWYHPKTDLPWLDRDGIGQIGQDREGNIWCDLLKQQKKMVGYFDKTKGRFIAADNDIIHPSVNGIYQLKQVSKNVLWVATTQGIIAIDTEQKKQELLTTKNGLPANRIVSLTPDKLGNVWYVTGNLLCKYDGHSHVCYHSNEAIGKFVHTSATLTREGLVMLGGAEGLHVFDPVKVEKDTVPPKVYLTGFRVHGVERNIGQALETVRKISLPFDENAFSLEFAAPYFIHTEKIRYQYQLEGFDLKWFETDGDERRIPYSNLQPGSYFFKVKAVNADGFWTDEKEWLNVELVILPPWYRTKWAWCLWIALTLATLYGLYRFQLDRQLAQAEAHRLKELDVVKSQLYTNITHEFRTPLTVILGMADLMKLEIEKLGDFQFSQFLISNLRLIRRNSKQLLHLVNQMLDLSKLESGNMPLHFVHGDIVAFIKYLAESFHSFADSKDIRLHFLSEVEELSVDYDPEKLQNIISNLLSNAIKYTPAGGDIYLGIKKEDANKFVITVKDTGIGISEKDLPHIFDRFYQADASSTRKGDGTGIGLSLCKELVKLMGGEISAKSGAGTGSQFIIVLPMLHENKHTHQEDIIPPSTALATAILPDEVQMQSIGGLITINKQPIVLLVEDNPDVVTYLTSLLSGHYEILTAMDGQSGIEQAIDHIPDLIVCDVMMPKKDGFEVCTTLKSDERTNHIPIILLTAKADQSSKIEGLSYGADAYLAKPFHKEELLVRIEKLIEGRRQLQQRFSGENIFKKISQNKQPTNNDLFLQKLIGIVELHLSDEHFGMPELCKQAVMSRTQLFRKLKALTGKSATRFIRSIRLEKAKGLLETSDLSVSEVAFQTGFGSAAYFSRVFQEEYGITPSEIRK